MYVVAVEGLCKDFAEGEQSVRVLHDISLKIPFGELTMISGPSGCGKTTLISIFTGILTATEGEIKVDGVDIAALGQEEQVLFRRQQIGFIFQQFNLLTTLTAAENAAMTLLAAGMEYEEAIAEARAVLSKMDMAEHTEKLPTQLSGGQQQRVAIARALVHQPKLIVCDEPTASLDGKSGESVMALLRKIANNQNRAVVVVTHDMRIYHFADRILGMTDGRITEEVLTKDYTTEELIKKFY